MKHAYKFCIIITVLFLLGCPVSNEPETILEIQNNISNCTLTQVTWGEYSLWSSLATGQSSYITIPNSVESTSIAYPIKFTMSAKNRSVYLVTEEKFLPKLGMKVRVVLTDETKVENPALIDAE